MKYSLVYKLFGVFLLFSTLGCTSNKKDKKLLPADQIYQKGVDLLRTKRYDKAAKEFDLIYFEYPGNLITPYAELMQAYSLYMDGKYSESVDVLDHFIKYHPHHADLVYAMYLKSMNYYMQISDPQRDQGKTEDARIAFETLNGKFGDTKYAKDLRPKFHTLNNHIVAREMEIGREYLRIKNLSAAVNRFIGVTNMFEELEISNILYLEEAFYRIVESYTLMGLKQEAYNYLKKLESGCPNSSIWLKKAEKLIQIIK